MFSASKTAAPVSGAYQISNSVRLRSAASAYFSRTPSVAGNRTTWTWSGWVKRGLLTSGTVESIFGWQGPAAGNSGSLYFNASSDSLSFGEAASTYRVTSSVLRDPSAWYHIVLVWDSNNATDANRCRIYVNNVLQTYSTSNTISSGATLNCNNTVPHGLACDIPTTGARDFFDGYLADINFIDGQALTPSSFGQINPTTGVWQPAKYTGSYGTNGFHLAFNNGTSTTTLGNDSSGNGNNWTPNNISLTAGSTYDWMLDSPTPYAGTSYGVGNYAVLNPLDNGGLTVASANLNSSDAGGSWKSIRSTIGISSGKWYWEVTATSGTNFDCGISKSTAAQSTNNYVGADADGWGYVGSNGQKYTAGSGSAYGATYTSGDVVGIAFDADAGTLTFYKNNVSQGTAFTGLTSGPYFPAVSNYSSGWAANFGQRPFAYTPPTGYKSLCTQNLPVPTIVNGSAHMNAVLDAGANIKTTSQALYTYYLEWIKDRANVNNHQLADTVRGNTAILQSNTTAAETTYTAPSGNSVGWVWNANAAAVTNTAGSITSQVSANTTAGFSVVTWTNPSSGNPTIGHGLGIAPVFVIVKSRTTAYNWDVGCTSIGWANRLILNSTSAPSSGFWNSTAPTSSVLTYSASGASSSDLMVAYCFAAIAGYSAFGSYTGNGSTDGPFVYCGFRPRYVLIKRTTDVAQVWLVWDTARNPYNLTTLGLLPNTSDADISGFDGDILSNGFKIRDTEGTLNASGSTYIYAAFAESPFSLSLAR